VQIREIRAWVLIRVNPWLSKEPSYFSRVFLIIFGLLLGQTVLYGPSLVGKRYLLPLDILSQSYLPPDSPYAGLEVKNSSLSDLVYLFEPSRRFAISEWRSGRVPLWNPNEFVGAPFVWPKFSPFLLLGCATESPIILAWVQLAAALVAGTGAYCFFRRLLQVGFWPAAIFAWCYPLTAFFVLWLGFPTSLAVYWLPWLLLAVDFTVQGTNRWAPVGLAIATALTLVSGHLDLAGQTLLASGLYASWQLLAFPERRLTTTARAAAKLTMAWGLGFMLASPQLLPMREYLHASYRMTRREAGAEERPPTGLSALPQVVLPDMYGSREAGSLRLVGSNQLESSATAYAGACATLLAAPLAFTDRRNRRLKVFWVLLSVLGLSWSLNVPGIVQVMRLPGLNLLSHNRFTFASAFSILALAAEGLETLRNGTFRWGVWMWTPLLLLAGLGGWCLFRSAQLPEVLVNQLPASIAAGKKIFWVVNLDDVARVQRWFSRHYIQGAIVCGLGVACWGLLRGGWVRPEKLVVGFGALMIAELLWFGVGRAPQSNPALYYPPVSVLTSLANASPGRIVGFSCLPANLAYMAGLRDIRGYDSVDPAQYVELLLALADPRSQKEDYAAVMDIAPRLFGANAGKPVLVPGISLLGVRYILFRGGTPPPELQPDFQADGYCAYANPQALQRVFVPRTAQLVTNAAARLQILSSENFDPGETACVEEPVALPRSCSGTATIKEESSIKVVVSAAMKTPGLLVLTDLWYSGWNAYLAGRPVPVLRVNHAFRGVVLPAGEHRLEFRYEPASFALGVKLAAFAAVALLVWFAVPPLKNRCSREIKG
jgi:hypothetical protein